MGVLLIPALIPSIVTYPLIQHWLPFFTVLVSEPFSKQHIAKCNKMFVQHKMGLTYVIKNGFIAITSENVVIIRFGKWLTENIYR